MTDTMNNPDDVAVVGFACRLPGAANADAFWQNLVAGVESVRRSTPVELRAAGFSDADLADPRFVPACGVLDDADAFDADFFGIAPARAARLDPQHRILLEVAWHAVEHAGYDPTRFPGDAGAYLSVGPPPFRRADSDSPEDALFGLTAGEKDYAASRVAYHLNLTGPCVLVQAASSSSLVAVHSAVEALVGGQCDAALAGGACVGFPQGGYRHVAEALWSPDGHCRPYDIRAAGTVPGFGAAVVVLKLLSAALADGDTVHAVIKGSAVNNDGAVKADYLAPSVPGQARAIGQALAAAGVSADTVGFVEGHGTGTPLGDPIEVRALTEAFRRDTARVGFCALGSVKANIGHLHTAGGIAGFLKAVLAVKHGVIPPTPHFSAPPPVAGFERTPFFVPTAPTPWPTGTPRRAGVSAFGFGGTNAHVVLEEAPAAATARGRAPRPSTPFRRTRFPQLGDSPLSPPARPAADAPDLLGHLRGLFAAALSKPPADLPADAPFDELGVDSLLVLSLTRRLEVDFGELSKALFFQHSTLRKLADHLAAARPDAARKLTRPPASSAVEPPAAAAPVAVVGLAGRYPGAADVRAFWANLRAGRDSVTELPADRWDWRPFAADDTVYTRWGGFLDGVDRFDPLFFGITPKEAKWLDPQQRLFLETAHAAVEDAGYTRAGLTAAARRAGGEVGVFVGVMNQPFLLVGADAGGAAETQANHWSVANRVSFCSDFRGPSVAVDTACSASLTAVHLACEAIRRGECGAAIAGGVNLILHPRQQAELCRVGMLSRGPATRAFGAGGDGFVHGEGVGAVVLKPLAAALADGDTVYGVIRGSAVNAGGRTAGYTVPDPAAQAGVVRQALAAAGVKPADIGYVEAHGTGTELGDPVEIAGLSEAFGPLPVGSVGIGSVKSNVGHLESAAGIAGLTKALLQLRHGELAPTLHADQPNPHLNLAATPFRLAAAAGPWAGPRRAGVSSFGAGGANAHVVVEEAPAAPVRAVPGGPWPVVLSARTPEQLGEVAARLAAFIRENEAEFPDATAFADAAFTLAVGREPLACRAATTARAAGDLLPWLDRVAAGAEVVPPPDLAGWVRGETVDWSPRFPGCRRRPLPTYPFARLRCWPEAATGKPTDPLVHPVLGRPAVHLGVGARWENEFTADAAVIRAHDVGGRLILPGVAYLEAARAAAEQAGRGPAVTLRDVVWLRPLAVGPNPVRAALDLRETGDSLEFEVRAGGTACATGRVAGPPSDTPPSLAPAAVRERCPHRWDRPAIYAKFRALGLDYRDFFQGLETLAAGDREAVGEIRLPATADPGLARCGLNPAVMDAALQTAAGVMFARADRPPERMLPFAADAVEVYGPVTSDGWAHAELLEDDPAARVARFRVTVTDTAGRVRVRVRDLAVRPDAGGTPVAPRPAAAVRLLTPWWKPAPVAGVTVPLAGTAVFFGPPAAAGQIASLAAAWPGRAVRVASPDEVAGVGGFDAVVWVAGPTPDGAVPPAGWEDDYALSPLRLIRAARAALPAGKPLRVVCVTTLTHAVEPGDPVSPWAAGAVGLFRVAAREFPHWSVACVDVDGTDAAVPADPGDAVGLEVAYRGGRRFVRRLRPADPPGGGIAFRRGGTYLILGGAGGIGRALAEHLGRTCAARVALVGRRPASAETEAIVRAVRSAGGEACYLSADATDEGQLRAAVADARRRFGPLHGVVHAGLVMADQALDRTDEAGFREAWDVKARGLLNLAAAAAGDPLDWLAVFSSATAFAATPGQANYVAGCAFMDALAPALRAAGVPARVINWGFWGEVGRVATPEYRDRLARQGVGPIPTTEGLAALDRVLAGGGGQTLAVVADDAALGRLGVDDTPVSLDPVAEYEALDTHARRRFAAWWRRHGVGPAEPTPAAALAAHLGLSARHSRLFPVLLDLLVREGELAAGPGGFVRGPGAAPPDADFPRRFPGFAPHVRLLETCLDRFSDVLADRAAATDVMFPGMSTELVEGMYHGTRLVDACNQDLARSVAAGVRGGGRVIEVGGGTGGATRAVLPVLKAAGVPVEYVFTDVSRGFTRLARERFGAALPSIDFRPLDIENDPVAQGFAAGTFDVVFAANAVHATRSVVDAVRHARTLLKPGGRLALYEMTANHDFVTLTFGLLDGWWRFDDGSVRLPGGPLLGPEGWRRVLAAEGFGRVSVEGYPAAAPRHTVIVAELVAPPEPAGNGKRASIWKRVAAPTPPSAPADVTDRLRTRLRTEIATALEIPPAELPADRKFADLGADSIISVGLIRELNRSLGIELKPTTLFNHPTVDALAGHIAARYGDQFTDAGVPTGPSAAPVLAPPPGAVAVIGFAGRFPGASDLDDFWANLLAGRDAFGGPPPGRWPTGAGGTAAFLDGIEQFDPLFFGLSPSEAELIDPQQRLFLETAWHALEHAGVSADAASGRSVGVFAGAVAGDYANLVRAAGRATDPRAFVGGSAAVLAARVAYHLNLHGPCLTVDTACSSSLTAIHLACESVRAGGCELALAGGVAVLATPEFHAAGAAAGMLSPTGRCRPLRAGADGFVPGEAVVVLVLKPLASALADGDRIHGVIRGTAVNQDGATNGLTAPSGPAQAEVIRRAHAAGGTDPATVSYVELHGTGTPLGDPIETDALAQAFAGADGRCGLGSVKGNVGHTLAASGATGLVKVLLALRHRRLPPTAPAGDLNPQVRLDATRFYAVDRATDWTPAPGAPLRAGVSSFGFGGSNAHAVLDDGAAYEEAVPRTDPRCVPVVVSAKTADALAARLRDLQEWLTTADADWRDVCFTLAAGRAHFGWRVAAVAAGPADLQNVVDRMRQEVPGAAVSPADPTTQRANADAAAGRLVIASADAAAWEPLLALYRSGATVDWGRLFRGHGFRVVGVPGYPFARRRCWIAAGTAELPRGAAARARLGRSVANGEAS